MQWSSKEPLLLLLLLLSVSFPQSAACGPVGCIACCHHQQPKQHEDLWLRQFSALSEAGLDACACS
jgi:hypothetical protein